MEWSHNLCIHLRSVLQQKPVSAMIAIILFFTWSYEESLKQLHINPLILYCLTGFLFFYIFLVEELFVDLRKKTTAIVSAIVSFITLYFIWNHHSEILYLIIQIPLFLSVGILFNQSLRALSDSASRAWQDSFIKANVEAIFIGIAFLLATYLVVYLVDFVFDIKTSKQIYELIFKFALTIVPSFIFLVRFNTVRDPLSKFGEGLIKFVVVPVWGIYTFFLNIYALKILIHWNLPKGQVALPVAIAFILYVLAWWVMIPLDQEKKYDFINANWQKCLRLMHVTLLALFSVAIFRRIADYGFTQPRFFLVLLLILFAGIVVLDLTRKLNGRSFSLLLLCLTLVSFIQMKEHETTSEAAVQESKILDGQTP